MIESRELYECGWRSEDKEELKEKYNLDEDIAEGICEDLERIEKEQKNKEPNVYELKYCVAPNLFESGWRSYDRDDLIREYELTEDEADIVCSSLDDIAKDHLKDEIFDYVSDNWDTLELDEDKPFDEQYEIDFDGFEYDDEIPSVPVVFTNDKDHTYRLESREGHIVINTIG